jgi:surface carbohydrate biosynthesis protein
MKVGRLQIGRQSPADVALLARNLEHWPEFLETTKDFRTVILETRSAPIPIASLWTVLSTMVRQSVSVGWASFVASSRESNVKVLLGTDQTREPFDKLAQLQPTTKQLLIAHGSVRRDTLLLNPIVRAEGRLLCVWGQHDAALYEQIFKDPVECVVVGSLRNAMHIKRHGLNPDRSPTLPLLFVSQFSGLGEDDPIRSPDRSRVLRTLKEYLSRYCSERNLPLKIAMRPPVSGTPEPGHVEDEIQHYKQVFAGVTLSFTDPYVPYSTYVASDAADVTIGVPSGSLTESFGRGNKVLMFGQAAETGSYFSFPFEGDWLVTEPSYQEFSDRLEFLRMQSRQSITSVWAPIREQMLADAMSTNPIIVIREILRRSAI